MSSSPSCKFDVCSTIAVNHSKKPANELWQRCLLKHMKNPGMIDTGILGYPIHVEHTQHGQGQKSRSRKCYPSFAWQRYIFGKEVFISWKTSERPREIAVVSILQSQMHSVNGRKASHDLTILPLLSMLEDLGINTVLLLASSAGIVPPSSTCLYALKRNCEHNPPAHL